MKAIASIETSTITTIRVVKSLLNSKKVRILKTPTTFYPNSSDFSMQLQQKKLKKYCIGKKYL